MNTAIILGLLTGVPLGLLVAVFALALCKAAARGDRALEAANRQLNRRR
jgi:hypothetical protein